MSSKRRLRRKQCEKKKRYASQEVAVQRLGHLKRIGKLKADSVPYPCHFCHGWHIGRRKQPGRSKIWTHLSRWSGG